MSEESSKIKPRAFDEDVRDPIIVTGYMHSGTTLVQRIIGGHAEVFAGGGETRHYSHLAIVRSQFPDLTNNETLYAYVRYLLLVICTGYSRVQFQGIDAREAQVFEDCDIAEADVDMMFERAQKSRDHAALLGITYQYLAAKQGKRRWLDKSPSYITILDDILSWYPDAHIIEIVRDPRDVLASKMRRTKDSGHYDPLWDTIAWRTAVRAGDAARAHFPASILRVRYEDLVSDPEAAVRSLCDFLDLEYDRHMLSVGWINTSIEGLSGHGIGTSAIGKWRNTLPASDLLICQQLAGGEMLANQYALQPVPTSAWLKYPLLLGRSGGELVVRMAKKWSRGGRGHLTNSLDGYRRRLRALRT